MPDREPGYSKAAGSSAPTGAWHECQGEPGRLELEDGHMPAIDREPCDRCFDLVAATGESLLLQPGCSVPDTG